MEILRAVCAILSFISSVACHGWSDKIGLECYTCNYCPTVDQDTTVLSVGVTCVTKTIKRGSRTKVTRNFMTLHVPDRCEETGNHRTCYCNSQLCNNEEIQIPKEFRPATTSIRKRNFRRHDYEGIQPITLTPYSPKPKPIYFNNSKDISSIMRPSHNSYIETEVYVDTYKPESNPYHNTKDISVSIKPHKINPTILIKPNSKIDEMESDYYPVNIVDNNDDNNNNNNNFNNNNDKDGGYNEKINTFPWRATTLQQYTPEPVTTTIIFPSDNVQISTIDQSTTTTTTTYSPPKAYTTAMPTTVYQSITNLAKPLSTISMQDNLTFSGIITAPMIAPTNTILTERPHMIHSSPIEYLSNPFLSVIPPKRNVDLYSNNMSKVHSGMVTVSHGQIPRNPRILKGFTEPLHTSVASIGDTRENPTISESQYRDSQSSIISAFMPPTQEDSPEKSSLSTSAAVSLISINKYFYCPLNYFEFIREISLILLLLSSMFY